MICGTFDGNIESAGTLYIDTGATVKVGTMKARSIIVSGSISGDIDAEDRVELRPTARVRGNIRTTRLRLADGVLFEGRCDMIKDSASFDPFVPRDSYRQDETVQS